MVWENNVIERTVRVVRTGVAEEAPGLLPDPGRVPTVVYGTLMMSPGEDGAASLHDAAGRRVMALMPGENDVRFLAPGVYFIRAQGPRGPRFEGSSRKVVIQR